MLLPAIVYDPGTGPVTLQCTRGPINFLVTQSARKHDNLSTSGLRERVLEKVDLLISFTMPGMQIWDELAAWATFAEWAVAGGQFDFYPDAIGPWAASDGSLSEIHVAGDVATARIAGSFQVRVGQVVVIAGATVDEDLNGSYVVASIVSSDMFTFATVDVADGTYTESTLQVFLGPIHCVEASEDQDVAAWAPTRVGPGVYSADFLFRIVPDAWAPADAGELLKRYYGVSTGGSPSSEGGRQFPIPEKPGRRRPGPVI